MKKTELFTHNSSVDHVQTKKNCSTLPPPLKIKFTQQHYLLENNASKYCFWLTDHTEVAQTSLSLRLLNIWSCWRMLNRNVDRRNVEWKCWINQHHALWEDFQHTTIVVLIIQENNKNYIFVLQINFTRNLIVIKRCDIYFIKMSFE